MPLLLALLVLAFFPAVASPATSEWIAFTGVHWSSNSAGVAQQIYLAHPDGSGQHRLGVAGRGGTDPAWSADGKRLAFGVMNSRGWRLYTTAADGSHPRALTATAGLAGAPSWSPDGRWIALETLPRTVPGRKSYAQQIYVVRSTGGRLRQVTEFDAFKGGASHPAWSPGGNLIAFAGRKSLAEGARVDIYVVRPSGGGLHRLLANAYDPAWSPDGTRIAFGRDGDIYTASATGGDIRRVTRTPKLGDTHPSWSPDATRLVFASMHRATNPDDDDLRLGIVNADGSGLHRITDTNPSFWADAPSWQP
jgi:Tol biopolymer transport system component